MTVKRMAIRRADSCVLCETELAAGVDAIWDSEQKTVTCVTCHEGPTVSAAGHSARAKGERLRQAQLERREALKAEQPIIGRLAIALAGPRREGQSWLVGAVGEEALGQRLDGLRDAGVFMLHDRRIPKSTANIDHIAVTPSGVWAIDAKRYSGLVKVVNKGGWFKSDWRLTVAGRDRTKLVLQVMGQMEHVAAALAAAGETDVPVLGALCFIDSEFPLFSKPETMSGVRITWGKALRKALVAEGPIDEAHRRRILAKLDAALRPTK